MSFNALLLAIRDWPVSAAIRGEFPGTEWLFPIVETLHVMAFSLVVGSIAMVDVRLLGLASRDSSISRLSAEVLPWTWISWSLAALSPQAANSNSRHTPGTIILMGCCLQV